MSKVVVCHPILVCDWFILGAQWGNKEIKDVELELKQGEVNFQGCGPAGKASGG